MQVDIGIVGGGVAGSALALALAQHGVQVALVEREPHFRDRIRGEAVHPWGVREVDRLGMRNLIVQAAGGRELPVWQTWRNQVRQDPTVWAQIHPSIPPVLSVGHPQLQQTLIDAAEQAGAHVFRPAEATLDRTANGPVMRIADVEVHCRMLVGADGANSSTRRYLGGTGRRDPITHYMAGVLVSGITLEPAAHHASKPGGFAMMFAQTDDRWRLYLVANPEQRTAIGPDASAIISAAGAYLQAGWIEQPQILGPAGFFPNADVVSSIGAGTDAVLIGDAAGSNDPSLGHGLSLVFRDVRVLSELLLNNETWTDIPEQFATLRATYYGVLREHARWQSEIVLATGEAGAELLARVARSRELDRTAGGFAGLFALGPDGLVADEAARRHFLGLDL